MGSWPPHTCLEFHVYLDRQALKEFLIQPFFLFESLCANET